MKSPEIVICASLDRCRKLSRRTFPSSRFAFNSHGFSKSRTIGVTGYGDSALKSPDAVSTREIRGRRVLRRRRARWPSDGLGLAKIVDDLSRAGVVGAAKYTLECTVTVNPVGAQLEKLAIACWTIMTPAS
jgi:hypothetical protein